MNAKKSFMEHQGASSAVALAGKEVPDAKLSIAEVRNKLKYNSSTGVFTWININKHHKEKLNTEAGCQLGKYIVIQVLGVKIRAHRLAWYITFGYMPNIIDHINGVTTDNRISNLRNVTCFENAQNHSRYKKEVTRLPLGVKLLKSGNYQARATLNGKQYALGSYKTKEKAHEKYKEFTNKYHNNPAVS